MYTFKELEKDNIVFTNEFYFEILKEYKKLMLEKDTVNIKFFTNNENTDYQSLSISFVSKKHEISNNWESVHQIFTRDESKNLEKTISKAILSLKQSFLKKEISKVNEKLKNEEGDLTNHLSDLTKLNKVLLQINKLLGRSY